MEYKQIHPSWRKKLDLEVSKPYFRRLQKFLKAERKEKKIFPNDKNVFSAFSDIPFEKIKLVIVGQDPYHTKNVANGLAFAVSPGSKIPPSLRNIYKEIRSDTGQEAREIHELKDQGVLLLNTILTVEESSPLSHKDRGWERFTDVVLRTLWESDQKIVFLLWGNKAKEKEKTLFKGEKGHLVLKAGHPSPLSARYFLGCKHFTKANAFLKRMREEIDWNKR